MEDCAKCSHFQFAAKICNELDKTKNCVFSPLLAAEIVIIVDALGSTLRLGDLSSDGVQISDKSNSRKLKSIKGVEINRWCNVYLNVEHYKLNRKLKKDVKERFNVKLKNIDFLNSIVAAELINKGVKKQSKRKIKTVLNHNDMNVDTNTILVNGLYFKALWHMKFNPDNTEETIFYLNNNETVNVFLMYRKEKYNYKDSLNLDAQLLLLPFKNQEVHMLIVLPKRVTGLDGVLQKLANGYDLMAEVAEMSNKVEVALSIPRFKIETEINLVEVLRKLGVTTMFDKAVQKVLIDVNEEGTEPKPERMTCGFIPRWKPRAIDFTADRPHLIVIIYENVPIIWVTFRGRFE